MPRLSPLLLAVLLPSVVAAQTRGAAPKAPAAASPARTARATDDPLHVIARRGGPLTLGRYSCARQVGATRAWKFIDLTAPNAYAWRGSGVIPGRMTHVVATGEIRFDTGALRGGGYGAVAGRRADGSPVFVLIDRARAPRADAYDYCTLQKR